MASLPLKYAAVGPNSPLAGAIGWFDFTGITLNPGDSLTGLQGTFPDGSTVTFDISSTATANGGAQVIGTGSPIYSHAAFGHSGYTAIGGKPILYNVNQGLIGAVTLFKLTNITLKDASNQPITDYRVIAADAEQTANTEGLTFFTNNGNWSMLEMLPSYNNTPATAPTVTGVGGPTVVVNGNPAATDEVIGAPVLWTNNPTEVDVTIQNGLVNSPGREGFAIGFVITTITVKKDIVGRINPADQFTLNIGGTTTATATTAGSTTGIQTQVASITATAGNTYTVNEAMAGGSVTPLAGYQQTVTAVNLTPGGTTPIPITGLPESITPALGDVIEYTITNTPITADLALTKTAAPSPVVAGSPITYTLTVTNNGPFSSQTPTITDAVPAGISNAEYSLDNGGSWQPYTGSVTLPTMTNGQVTTVLVRGTVSPSATSSLVNTATVAGPTPDLNQTNNTASVTTPITTSADMKIVKTVAPTPIVAGQSATYTLVVTNLGPSTALNVTAADAAAATLTNPQYTLNGGSSQAWSGSAALGTMLPNDVNTIVITGIVPAGATGNLDNTATVTSTTPDPVPGNNTSTVTAPITVSADVSITKSASPSPVIAGQTATYTLTVKNAGPSDAQSVLVTDATPAGLTSPQYSIDSGNTWAAWPGSVNVGTVTVGEVDTILIKGIVDPATTTSLANTATVASPTPDPNQANNTANLTTPINTSADMKIVKTFRPNPVVPGQSVTYTLVVTNLGPSTAQSVSVADALAANLTAPKYTLNGGAAQNWTGSLALGSVAVNAVNTIVITGTVPSGATGNLANTASVTSTTPDPNQANNTSSTTAPLSPSADVSITKSVSPDPVVAGQLATYTLTVKNAGPSDALSVLVTDATPAGLTSPQYSTDGGTTWQAWPGSVNIGTVTAGQTKTILVEGIVDPTLTGNLVNTVTVASPTPDPDKTNNTATVTTPINTSADISVTKTALPTPMVPGTLATYTLTVKNAGPSVAQTVSLTDAIPAALTSPQYSTDGGTTWQAWSGSLSLGNLAVNASQTVLVKGIVDATATTSVANTAKVNSPTPDPVPGNNTANVTTQVAPSADLSIVKTVLTSPVVAGQPIEYSLVISNAGPSAAQSVVVADPIVATIGSPQYSTDGGTTWQPWTGSLAIATLAVGASDTILIKGIVGANATGVLDNQATISSATPDPNPSNNTSDVKAPVTTSADVSVTKKISTTPIVAGQMINYTIHVANAGPSDAQNVTVTDPLAAAISAPEYSLDGGSTWIPWIGTLALNTLAAGASQDLLIRGKVASATTGNLANTVTVASSTPDPTPANNTATATGPVTASADLAIVKTASPTPVVPGKEATYTLTVTNNGPSDAQNVLVADTAPNAMTSPQYSTDNGVTWAPWTGSVNVGTVASGAKAIVLIKGTIGSNVVTDVANTATVASPTPDPNPANNTSVISTPVAPSADISVTKVASPSPIVPGQNVTYTLVVKNAGPSDAQAVTLTDAVVAAISQAQYSLDGGATWQPWSGNLVLGNLTAGQMQNVQIKGMVDPTTTSSIANTAKVASPTPDPTPSNNTATIQTPVAPSADVKVAKVLTTPVVAGQKVGYTLTVTNAGPSTAQSVVLSDAVAAVLLTPEYSTDGGVTWQPWSGSLAVGNMAPNAVKVVNIRGTLSPSATGNLANTASVASPTPDPDPANNKATVTTPIDVLADVSVVNTLNTTPVVAGAPIAYTVTVKNAGPSDAQNVVLTDAVPSNILNPEYSTDGGVTWQPWTGSLPLGTLASGATKDVLLRGTVSPSATGSLATTATVASTTPDPNLANNTSSNTAPITTSADIAIAKTSAPNPAIPGNPITYTLTVTNAGPSDAQSVLVTDAVASTLDNPQYSLDGGATWQPWIGSLNIGTVGAKKSQVIEITGTLNKGVTGNLTNTASLTSTTPDPNPANNTTTIKTLVNKVEIIKTASTTGAVLGDTITYTLKVVNSGEVVAENMVVKDVLPAGLTYANNLKVGGVPTAGDITAGITIGNVAVGQTVLITFDAKVTSIPENTQIQNQGTGNYVYRKDPSSPPIAGTAPSNINQVTLYSPKLDMTKVSSTPSVVVGEAFVYTIKATNSGDIALNNVNVVDALPTGFIVQSITVDGVAINGDIRAGINIGNLAVGQTKTVDVTIKVADTASISTFNNVVKGVGDALVDPAKPPYKIPGEATDTAGISLYNPKLVIAKSADKAYAILGDIVTYTLNVTNQNNPNLKNIPLNNVVIADLLPAQLEFIPGSMNIIGGNILVGVNIGTLGIGETKVITFQAKVISANPRPIMNTATGRFEYTLPGRPMQVGTATSNPYTLQVTIVSLNLVKVANEATVSLGDRITYTVTLTNTGEVPVSGVVFTDQLPAQVSFVAGSFTLNGQVVNNIDLAVGIIIPTIAVGQTVTLTYQVEVTGSNCSGMLVNSAQATYEYKLADGRTGTLTTDSTNSSVSLQMNISTFKQMSIENYLLIPEVKPDIEAINNMTGTVDIGSMNVIETTQGTSVEGQKLTGYKLIVRGTLNLVIEYTALDETQSVHSAHYSVPFSTFIILPKDYTIGRGIEIDSLVEDIYYNAIDIRKFFTNTTVLINAKILSC